jgi:hypothetical protein
MRTAFATAHDVRGTLQAALEFSFEDYTRMNSV